MSDADTSSREWLDKVLWRARTIAHPGRMVTLKAMSPLWPCCVGPSGMGRKMGPGLRGRRHRVGGGHHRDGRRAVAGGPVAAARSPKPRAPPSRHLPLPRPPTCRRSAPTTAADTAAAAAAVVSECAAVAGASCNRSRSKAEGGGHTLIGERHRAHATLWRREQPKIATDLAHIAPSSSRRRRRRRRRRWRWVVVVVVDDIA